ncbi:serine/threonine-protein phosphatase with EF-hands 2 isoform X2 [Esox lucius]|uniref:serine/threonine-protein phosphatase with EF-hands 2 isoform X2 n=1 Tax=Esox lucius TaxID=8010 RepID=UPI00147760F7|nr:serine/threonine-protein phosphatase with EF-hands 2 isoform X2 [Esox lucius]
MGCGFAKSDQAQLKQLNRGTATAMRAALLIQRWYRQYVARLEMRRRCTWNIFQSIEYAGEQDQIKLYNFFGYLMDHFTPASSERNLISHIFREHDIGRDVEWESYKSIEVPELYSGPHLSFPMTFSNAAELVEAFKNKQQLHSRYVLQLLVESWRRLRILPNISQISTCHSKEITICGDLHGHLEDLLLVFYKNGLPSSERPYVFNGDYVDRGKDSLEILLILFSFLLVYPNDVHLNRGNHEDHIVNLRYGFTKEVLGKYKLHGKKILKLLQKIFSWLPLATVIDHKVLVLHGGISDTTDLHLLSRVDRHKYVSALRPPKSKKQMRSGLIGSDLEDNDPTYEFVGSSRRRVRSLTHTTYTVTRHEAPRRSLQVQTTRVTYSVEEELKKRRRQAGLSQSYRDLHNSTMNSDLDSDPDSGGELLDSNEDEWKQIVDLLWSDPMPQDGCIPNDVRGGGCYWGPNVTEEVLRRHNLTLLIRSHECKQEGYEFCHNRKVLTIFSASNYYEVGSNRGAYIRMGPDLVPHFIQYQANRSTRELTLRQSVGQTERSALKALREKLFAHKSELVSAFQVYDPEHKGRISLGNWASAMEAVLKLGLPWRMLRSQLVGETVDGMLDYQLWFRELSITEHKTELSNANLLETMYKNHSNLETIFRIIDTDNSGLISLEEFRQTWKLLSTHLQTDISDKAISDLAVSIDFNKDGSIDINEFMEAFRLVGGDLLQHEDDVH